MGPLKVRSGPGHPHGDAAFIDALTVGLAAVSAPLLMRYRIHSTWLVLGGEESIMGRFLLLAVLLCLPAAARAQEATATPRFELRTVGELGFLFVHSNTVRYGQEGTLFRFTEEGGQDNLFPLTRLAAELSWRGRLRYLGGGARGTDEKEAASGRGDGYSSNWLDTASVTLGFLYRLPADG